MAKKRSVGVAVFGILIIIFSMIILYGSIRMTIFFGKAPITQIIMASLWLISGIGVLRLIPWARITIIIPPIYIILNLAIFIFNKGKVYDVISTLGTKFIALTLICIIFSCLTIFFFTRPKVKEQFK